MKDAMSRVEFASTKLLEIFICRLVGRSRQVHGTSTNSFPTSVMKRTAMISLIQFIIWRSKVSPFFSILDFLVLKRGLGDDEYDYWKVEAGNAMKDRMGLAENPLDGVVAKACVHLIRPYLYFLNKIADDNRLANRYICSNISSKLSPLNSALWTDRK